MQPLVTIGHLLADLAVSQSVISSIKKFAQYLSLEHQRRKKSMNRKNILLVTTPEISNDQLRAWTSIAHPYHVNIAHSDEQAIEWCHLQRFDVVVVDVTGAAIDGKKLNAVVPILQEEVTIIQFDGEPAEKLSNNIEAIFNAKKYKRILNMILEEPAPELKWELPQFSLN